VTTDQCVESAFRVRLGTGVKVSLTFGIFQVNYLEVFWGGGGGGCIDMAVGGVTQPMNQPENSLFLLVREGCHLAMSPLGGKLWLDRCLGGLIPHLLMAYMI
jgi:hypothetical protein